MSDAQPLAGKVALVTGASRGIGRAIAQGFARAGAAVACLARDAAALARVANTIESEGGRALALAADVTDAAAMTQAAAATTATFGGLDIIVVNAGVNLSHADVASSDPTAWRQTVEVNLFGAYHTIRATIPHLKARGTGKIITVGSGLGHHPIANDSAYAASKAALWSLTRAAALELAAWPISVNELIPGPVETNMTTDHFRATVVAPSHEWLKDPEDVVPLALFLATQPDRGPTAQSYNLMRRGR